MSIDSTILDAFFEECDDLLAALQDGLNAMLDGAADDETVNAVFRAVHSIKGAAGAFAFDDLVGFAHRFETVLDAVRAGRLEPDENVMRVLQRAGDVLADLVDAARDAQPVDSDRTAQITDELGAFLPDAPEEEEAFSFEAVSLDFAHPPVSQFSCSFTPTAAFYAAGHDPLLLIRAVQELGETDVKCDFANLPKALENFDLAEGYLTWTAIVFDQTSDLALRQIFEFVEELSALEIKEVVETSSPLDQFLAPRGQEETIEPPAGVLQSAPTPAKQLKPAKKAGSTLRVDPERVDKLINAVGELIINQSVIAQRLEQAGLTTSSDLLTDLEDYRLLARDIQEGVMAIRAQPVKPLFQRMLRIAREAADATGKDVELVTTGDATEIDKTVVERLADPLTHMVRNAIDHGIEATDQRAQSGKPKRGRLRLSASQQSGSIAIEISDDGAGLNRTRIKEIALAKGLIDADAQLSEQEIDHLLFAPGFSTVSEVTNLSGRGVGMDVVKNAITELGGKIAISSVFGHGTTFSITLPLTLAVMDGMVINVSGQTMVVPIASILETIRPRNEDLSKFGRQSELLRIRGDYVPIIHLADRLGSGTPDAGLNKKVLLLVQTQTQIQCALAVDEILDQRQVVVKSMHANYGDIAGISGATILGDGSVALIVDTDAIVSPPKAPIIQSATHAPKVSYAQ